MCSEGTLLKVPDREEVMCDALGVCGTENIFLGLPSEHKGVSLIRIVIEQVLHTDEWAGCALDVGGGLTCVEAALGVLASFAGARDDEGAMRLQGRHQTQWLERRPHL